MRRPKAKVQLIATDRAHQRCGGVTPLPYGRPMPQLTSLLRGLGTAGATANARAELETAHIRNLQATIVAQRVNRSGHAGHPLSPAAEARVA